MLRKLLSLCQLGTAITCALALPLIAGAKSKVEPIDLSIIEQRDELTAFMTPQQGLKLQSLERLIQKGQAEVRSGQHLTTTKPSALNPNVDVNSIIARGEAMMESGQLKVIAGQQKLVAFLKKIDAQRDDRIAVLKMKYDFALHPLSYPKALHASARSVLDACRRAGYTTVFFDHFFVTKDGATEPTSGQFRNEVYDALIEADGTHYSVRVPIDLKLAEASDNAGSATLTFEGAQNYANEKIALIAAEIIDDQNGGGLLFFRAIDIETHVVIAHSLDSVTNVSILLELSASEGDPTPEALTDANETAEAAAPLPDAAPLNVVIRDTEMWIDKLAQLREPYKFAVAAIGIEAPSQANRLKALLEHSILTNSDLTLVESDFIRRAYGQKIQSSLRQANAILNIAPSPQETANNSFLIRARAGNSENVIEIGTISVDLL